MTKRKNRPIEEVIDSKRDLAREYAVENTPVRLDGVGEHPAIQAAASPAFATMSNEDAFNVALQLQQIVRGNASILDNQEIMKQDIARVSGKMRKYDEAAQKWEEDKLKFMDEVNRKADRLRITDPAKLGEMSAQVMQEEARAVDIAKALQAQNKAKFIDVINKVPKVRIISPGVVEQGRIGNEPIVRLIPEVIRIKNFEWKLPPGVPVEVPDFVAKRFEQIQQQRAELAERQQDLSADRNNGAMSDASEVTARMAQIDKKYGVATPSE